MTRLSRAVSAGVLAAAAVVAPVATASPATADIVSCVEYLDDQGFGPELTLPACTAADQGDVGACIDLLYEQGVSVEVATLGCERASGWPVAT